jgi:hypothetical protein
MNDNKRLLKIEADIKAITECLADIADRISFMMIDVSIFANREEDASVYEDLDNPPF